MKVRFFSLIVLFILVLTACQPAPASVQSTPTKPSPQLPQITPQVVENPAVELFPPESPLPTQPPQDEQPLNFSFPAPGPAPISSWRPPLYDSPWALGPYDHFFFSRPIAANEVNWPLADYRYGGYFIGLTSIHTGIDIDAPKGTPVIAAAPGKVVKAGYGLFYGNNDPLDPYGLAVTIQHDFGYNGQTLYTVYAHMDQIDVIQGQRVETGTQLGVVGETGNTTGPHLHFEVRLDGNRFFATYNPELWLIPPQGWGVLVGQLRNTNGSFLTEQDVTVKAKQGGRTWIVRSYGSEIINSDEYYKENLVLSDLPAGRYTLTIDYLEGRHEYDVTIRPGAITYFSFQGELGFSMREPPQPANSKWLRFTP